MKLSSRSVQVTADKTAQNAIMGVFRDVFGQVRTALDQHTGADGRIDLAHREAISTSVRGIVEPQFVRRVAVAGEQRQAELDHLDGLIGQARRDLRAAPAHQTDRITARITALGERRDLLIGSGVAFVALRGGRGLTPYARIVLSGAETVTRATLARHAVEMERILAASPDVLAWLGSGPQTVPARFAWLAHQPISEWIDVRGYTLSDRIWRTSEQTIARIDAILADGIARGRSAVAIARDLEPFLLAHRRRVTTRTPYGTIGSFDARRLARSEITRAASLSSYVAGITNPFVVRADYHLSGSHDPTNCDGTCDQHYADGLANDGYPPDDVPLPMIDTHPQCMCYITQRTEKADVVIAQLREQYQAGLVEPARRDPPITPLLQDVLTAVLMGWTVEQLAA